MNSLHKFISQFTKSVKRREVRSMEIAYIVGI